MAWWDFFFFLLGQVTFHLLFMVLLFGRGVGGTAALRVPVGLPCTKPSWGHAHGLTPRPLVVPVSVPGEAQGGGGVS